MELAKKIISEVDIIVTGNVIDAVYSCDSFVRSESDNLKKAATGLAGKIISNYIQKNPDTKRSGELFLDVEKLIDEKVKESSKKTKERLWIDDPLPLFGND